MSVNRNRRKFTKEFKVQIVREVEAGKSVAQAAREHEVHPNNITNWRTQLAKYGADAFQGTATRTPTKQRSPSSKWPSVSSPPRTPC